ncbi:MAG: hypothetical protein JXA25_18200 [Anaerolineales bacterium]|nr:hypothetical protein [Anaerolineales bacterium]
MQKTSNLNEYLQKALNLFQEVKLDESRMWIDRIIEKDPYYWQFPIGGKQPQPGWCPEK